MIIVCMHSRAGSTHQEGQCQKKKPHPNIDNSTCSSMREREGGREGGWGDGGRKGGGRRDRREGGREGGGGEGGRGEGGRGGGGEGGREGAVG